MRPKNLVGDNGYDSDKLDSELRRYGIELIAPHRMNRKNTTQDLRRLRRYRRRWKIERLFAWLQNFRRLVVRYELTGYVNHQAAEIVWKLEVMPRPCAVVVHANC